MLREFRLDDEVAVHRYGSDEEVTRYLTWDQTRRPTPRRISSGSLARRPESLELHSPRVATLDDELIGVANLAITGKRR